MKTTRYGIITGALVVMGLTGSGLADLDEAGFDAYRTGSLHGQKNWTVECIDGNEYRAAPERVEVVAGKGKQQVEFKAGFQGRDQTRLLKGFPATTSPKVVVTLDFTPGSETLGGRLYFDDVNGGGGVALQFLRGEVYVLEDGSEKEVDTGVTFNPEQSNHFEIRLDFEAHKFEVILNRTSVGVFKLPTNVERLDRLNFYGGGGSFSSFMSNLSIASVDKFEGGVSERKAREKNGSK